ncbi:hypothetical protein Q3G72_020757 [Acer saccharum]|nr:hypothetical protein Q3G72_020757 [Acer saccharum]
MEIFSRGVLSTPALRKVKIDWELIEPDVDLHKTIQQLYEKEHVQSSEDDIEPSFLHLSDQGSDKDYGDFSRHDPNDQRLQRFFVEI